MMVRSNRDQVEAPYALLSFASGPKMAIYGRRPLDDYWHLITRRLKTTVMDTLLYLWYYSI